MLKITRYRWDNRFYFYLHFVRIVIDKIICIEFFVLIDFKSSFIINLAIILHLRSYCPTDFYIQTDFCSSKVQKELTWICTIKPKIIKTLKNLDLNWPFFIHKVSDCKWNKHFSNNIKGLLILKIGLLGTADHLLFMFPSKRLEGLLVTTLIFSFLHRLFLIFKLGLQLDNPKTKILLCFRKKRE